jgi:hypothetical protein
LVQTNTFSFTDTLGVTFSLGIWNEAGQRYANNGKNEPLRFPN